MKLVCYDNDGNEWLVHSTKKAKVGEKSVFILILKHSCYASW